LKIKIKSNLILVLIETWFNTLNWLCLTRWILYLIQYKTQLKSFLELINYRVDLQNFTGFSTNPLKFLSRTSGEHPEESKGAFVCLMESGFLKTTFKLSCTCLSLEKLVNRTHFSVKGKFSLVFRKCFSFILGGKHFLEVVKNLEMLYYLLIISNLILKFLIAIYILFWKIIWVKRDTSYFCNFLFSICMVCLFKKMKFFLANLL